MCSPRASFALVVGLFWAGCTPATPKPAQELDVAPEKAAVDAPTALAAPPPAETEAPIEAPSSPTPAPAQGELLLYDFAASERVSWKEPSQIEVDRLLQRFPHPHAAASAHCDPNSPGTPAAERMGGILLPRVTLVQGAFTSAGAVQTAHFIDYCPSGVGVPRTRRIVVLQGDTLALDHELDGALKADEVLRAVDVNGDGLAELLLTVSIYNPQTTQTTTGAILYQLKGGAPRVLGRWTGIAHCYLGHDDRLSHRIFYRLQGGAVSFRDETVEQHCYYPPAPPPPR